jgi:hypothetical protein
VIVILAGTYVQGLNYAKEQGLAPRDYVIPSRPEQVYGLDVQDVRKVGTWRDLPQEVLDAVAERAWRTDA